MRRRTSIRETARRPLRSRTHLVPLIVTVRIMGLTSLACRRSRAGRNHARGITPAPLPPLNVEARACRFGACNVKGPSGSNRSAVRRCKPAGSLADGRRDPARCADSEHRTSAANGQIPMAEPDGNPDANPQGNNDANETRRQSVCQRFRHQRGAAAERQRPLSSSQIDARLLMECHRVEKTEMGPEFVDQEAPITAGRMVRFHASRYQKGSAQEEYPVPASEPRQTWETGWRKRSSHTTLRARRRNRRPD